MSVLKIFLSCRIKLVDPDKFLSAKVDFRLNATFAFERCSLALARMDCILCDKRQYLLAHFLFLTKCRLPVCKLNFCEDLIDQRSGYPLTRKRDLKSLKFSSKNWFLKV